MIIPELPVHEYHAAPHVSASKLSTFLQRGPRAYWLRHVRQSATRPQTKAFDVGQAFEDALRGYPSYVFPPDDLKVASNGAMSTKEAKAWKAEQEAQGLTVLDRGSQDLFEHGIAHLKANRTAMALIEASEEQVTIRSDKLDWIPGGDALPGLQSRPDWLSLSGCAVTGWRPVAPDLKTTTDLVAFVHSVRKYGYHRQAGVADLALTDDGVPCGDVVHPLIVVEKAWPYRCQVIWLSGDYCHVGRAEATEALVRLAPHYESGEWPTVTEDETTLEPPYWLLSQYESRESAADGEMI